MSTTYTVRKLLYVTTMTDKTLEINVEYKPGDDIILTEEEFKQIEEEAPGSVEEKG